MSHDGKPLCLRDYNAKYGVRCYECDKFIAGKVLQVLSCCLRIFCCSCYHIFISSQSFQCFLIFKTGLCNFS